MAPIREREDEDAVGSAARNKKRNAALSCAECRRLKLRCDRKFPCSACVKRGCSAICPDGSLTTGKGNRLANPLPKRLLSDAPIDLRFVLANTESLHEKIAELSHRVRELEDALARAHGALSNDRHPLLHDDLLRIKNPLEREAPPEPTKEPEDDDTIDAIGSLAISHTGRTNFYGQTANAWYLLQNEDHHTSEEETRSPDLGVPTDVPWLSHAFPFAPTISASAEDVRGSLIRLLPSAAEARQIVDCYYEHAALMYNPISRPQFEETVFARIYDQDLVTDHDPFESHRLSMLFMVLALGTLVDLNIPSHSPRATQFYQLARAALSIDSVLEEASVPAIQALFLMCHFLFLADIHSPRWAIMGIIVKLAQSIGLHRDSTRWNLDEVETQKRRELMWEIFVYDSWQSLTYGRPPSFSMAHIDSKMAHETTLNGAGQVEMTYSAWKHRFSSECLSIVHDQAYGARAPPYSTILDLDKKVRNYYVPPSLQVPGFGGSSAFVDVEQPSVRLTMQRYIILAIKEISLLYMHRGFFARAMDDQPEDPLGSKYGQSVLSAHRSASSFVALVKSLWSQHRALTERMWFLFTHVFSCAIVLGSIPTKCPSMGLARSALQNLDYAYDLFTQVSETSRAAKVLPVLKKLRERAHASMSEFQNQTGEMGPRRETSHDPHVKLDDEELATLGGKTRLVSPKPQSPSSSRTTTSSPEAFTPHYSTTSISYAEPMQPLIPEVDPHVHHRGQEMSMYSMIPPSQPHWSQHNSVQDMSYMSMPMQQQQMMDMSPQNQFTTYEYVESMRSAYMPSHAIPHGAHDSMSPPVVDLDASWRSWMDQFNTS